MPDLKKIFERTTIAIFLVASLGLALLLTNPRGTTSQWVAGQLTADPPYHYSEDPGEGFRAVYPYMDESGNMSLAATLTQVPAAQRDHVGRMVVPLGQPLAEILRGPKVTLYSTSWCHYCKSMMDTLDQLGIAFENKDVERTYAIQEELLGLSGSTAIPFTIANGEPIYGYDPQALKRVLLNQP